MGFLKELAIALRDSWMEALPDPGARMQMMVVLMIASIIVFTLAQIVGESIMKWIRKKGDENGN